MPTKNAMLPTDAKTPTMSIDGPTDRRARSVRETVRERFIRSVHCLAQRKRRRHPRSERSLVRSPSRLHSPFSRPDTMTQPTGTMRRPRPAAAARRSGGNLPRYRPAPDWRWLEDVSEESSEDSADYVDDDYYGDDQSSSAFDQFKSNVLTYEKNVEELAIEAYDSPPSEWTDYQWDVLLAAISLAFLVLFVLGLCCARCCRASEERRPRDDDRRRDPWWGGGGLYAGAQEGEGGGGVYGGSSDRTRKSRGSTRRTKMKRRVISESESDSGDETEDTEAGSYRQYREKREEKGKSSNNFLV